MTSRVPITRPLTDTERDLLAWLTMRTVADQLPCTDAEAADALDELAGDGLVYRSGDWYDAYVTVNGHVIVHCTREWLAFQALAEESDGGCVRTQP